MSSRSANLLSVRMVLIVTGLTSLACHAAEGSLDDLPIREVTVFKDGHAFVIHEGTLPTADSGDVRLDALPTPIMGTFWPYSNDKRAKLVSVSAGKQRVSLNKTALSLSELVRANIGADVEIREDDKTFDARIIAVPVASADEISTTNPDDAGPHLPRQGEIVLLKTEQGTRAIRLDRIQDITFLNDPQAQVKYEEIRNQLTMHLDWFENKPGTEATVGMSYLQRGLRWIPQYKVTINGDGTAHVQLQATLINELANLEAVTMNLLIGVPSFEFKGTLDPIAFQETMANLSPYFDQNTLSNNFVSNAIMTQTQAFRMNESRSRPQGNEGLNLGPEMAGAGANEEMFVFTLRNITLAKGHRMVLPVGEWTMKTEDVFKLEVPFAPPLELRQNFNSTQQQQLAEMLYSPKVKQVLRITNNQKVPLTTAPALIMSQKGVLGQGMMTYTSPGNSVDLEVNTAINIPVEVQDDEIERTPDAMRWNNNSFLKVDLAGNIKLTNYRDNEVRVEVVRTVLGNVSESGKMGTIRKIDARNSVASARPVWWNWYSWPYWWSHFNSVSRVDWDVEVASGESVELTYQWHYFWRY